MKTYFDCIPCFLRQALDAVRAVTDDPRKQEMILRGVLHLTSQMDLKDSPPSMGKRIHSLIREASRNSDPYLAIKERCNRFAHDL
ncbi:MAG TPA: ARMT1-like domain-containing protein, partial [bacterium]|nr:ARMT1-like domain-containing protein [bacterium]